MESARAFDAPLPPESERRLARIFCFLRQHERKAKAARKSAELQKLSSSCAAPSSGSGSKQHQRRQRGDQRRTLAQQQQTVSAREGAMLDDGDESDSSNKSNDDDEDQAGPATGSARADQHHLLNELDARLDTPRLHENSPMAFRSIRVGDSDATTDDANRRQQVENERRALIAELSREIRELQKGILPTTSASAAAAASGTAAAAATGALELSGCISAGDIASAMRAMNRAVSKTEVQWMIWEVDDDLDGSVDWHEFRGCYARTVVDKHGLEANQLYHLIQFLLCDADESFTVSVLEIKAELKKLPGTDHLAAKLLVALKDDAEQQLLQKFTLSEYLDIMLADLPSSSPLVGK